MSKEPEVTGLREMNQGTTAAVTVTRTSPPLQLRMRRRGILEIFPVTFVLVAQYVSLVLYPAVIHQTSPISTILIICTVAICSAFVIELLLMPIQTSRIAHPCVSSSIAKPIIVVGWIAQGAIALTGQLGYASQISGGGRSSLASLATPFQYWPLLGLSLIFYAFQQGKFRRINLLLWTAATLLVQLLVSMKEGRLAPLFVLILTLVLIGLIVGLIRLRMVVLFLALVPIFWPILYTARNQIRASEGASSAEQALHSPSQRLRLDLELAQVNDFSSIPANLPLPGIVTLFRFGLIPSVLDRTRGTIDSAGLISIAMGGPSTNSASLTTLGELYVEQGFQGLIIYGSATALMVGYLIRRRGPWTLSIIAITVSQILWIEETVPDFLAGFLQSLASLFALWIVVKVLSSGNFRRMRAASEAQPQNFNMR